MRWTCRETEGREARKKTNYIRVMVKNYYNNSEIEYRFIEHRKSQNSVYTTSSAPKDSPKSSRCHEKYLSLQLYPHKYRHMGNGR